jgi:putative hemolysin
MAPRTHPDPMPDPFRLPLPPLAPFHHRAVLTAARPVLSQLLALGQFRRLYELMRTAEGATFCARALKVLGSSVDVEDADARRVPAEGPLIIVANHPHGMLDGLALVDTIERTRRDVRVMTNDLLAPIPELATLCLFVDAYGQPAAARTRAGLGAALDWLHDGHVLVVFPAGSVACQDWRTAATPLDDDWRTTVTRLAARTGALIVPAHITGRNSKLFYRAGEVHPTLRTLLLARELLARRGQRVGVALGPALVLPRGRCRRSRELTSMLRAQVERLAGGASTMRPRAEGIAPAAEDELSSEIADLPCAHRLMRSGRLDVYCAPASSIPRVLQEIGRLREVTFRSVGEGTGNAFDLDRFDRHYRHLFVWDRDARMIAGAYRLGIVDRILATEGVEGLYTSTLYEFDQRLLSRLGAAVELGRSFVRAEYQRSSNTLLLLWKGIAQFVTQSGGLHVLFGPVSISARYTDMSRLLLRAFLLQNARHRELGELVTALTPPGAVPSDIQASRDVQTLDRLVAGYEPDGKGMPVLLRQYLRLNAKLLAFNIDPAFNDALDALMLVDLTTVDRAILTRYFGAEHAQRLLDTSSRLAAA